MEVTNKRPDQALAELELSHSQLEAIFAAQNDVVILYDTEMNVYRANPSFLANYGFDPTGLNVKEIIRRVSCRWLDGRPLALEDQPTPLALRGERITGAHFVVKKADGTEAIVETSSGPVRIGEKIVGSVTVWHDITEFKRIERELLAHKERELSQALVTLNTMLDTIPVGVIVAEAGNEKITNLSPAAREIMGVSPSVAVAGYEFGELTNIKLLHADRSEIPPEDWPLARALHLGENTENEEIIVLRDDGREVTTVVDCAPVRDDNGRILRAVASIVNITKRKQMENALRESEERFRVLTEALPQLVWTIDAAGKFNYLNNQFHQYTGINTADLIKRDLTEIIHPDDVKRRIECWSEAINSGNTYQIEYRLRRYDGEYRWFLARGLPLRDQQEKIICWFGTCTDIHYQKQLEIELQETNSRLHILNKEMMTTLEEERRTISRELHDEAGQALTALKMYIELILNGLPPDAVGLRQRISEAVNLTNQTLKEIRRLAQDLRPPALDALGLNYTLEDFCYEFSKRVGLNIEYQGCELPVLTGIARITLYRFLQEALTNVVKHAKADLVEVRLGYCNQQISLVVIDNGSGFEADNGESAGKNMGLVGMRERLAIMGGTLTIDSRPGRGTRLMATIPWEAVQ